jgi:hypothetical protein
MKKSFKSMVDKADPKTLELFFADIDQEKVSGDTVSRIQTSVLKQNAPKQNRSSLKKWIPLLSAAACLVIVVGVVLGVGILNRKSPASVIPSDDKTAYGEIKLSVSKETKDKFSKDLLPADGPASDVAAEPMLYYGIRFYDSKGSTYMIYREGGHVFKYEDGSFTDTGVCPAEKQFFKTYEKFGFS